MSTINATLQVAAWPMEITLPQMIHCIAIRLWAEHVSYLLFELIAHPMCEVVLELGVAGKMRIIVQIRRSFR